MIKNDIRSVQLVQLELLKVFDSICKKYNLTYWIDAGTLLGAVRHKGFIPWDDDLDVGMPSKDYHEFLKIVEKEVPNNLFIQTSKTDPSSPFLYTKLRDKNSLYIEPGSDFDLPYHKGIYMDIFEFVDYPKLSKSVIRFFYKKIGKRKAELGKKHYLSFKSVSLYFIYNIEKCIFELIWKLINLFKSNKYTSLPIYDNGYFIQQKSENIFPVKTIKFEDGEFYGPNNPDSYLKVLYGNYMQVPPEDKRQGHAYAYFVNVFKN